MPSCWVNREVLYSLILFTSTMCVTYIIRYVTALR